MQPEGLGPGALPADEVELEILHRRVERFLDRASQPVNLVDKEDVTVLEVGQDRRERALVFDGWPGSGADADPHLVGDDVGQGRLAQAGRARDQDVLDRLAAALRGGDQDLEVGLDRLLPDELGQLTRAQAAIELLVLAALVRGHDPLRHPRSSPLSATVTSCSTE